MHKIKYIAIKEFRHILRDPRSLAEAILARAGVDPGLPAGQVSRDIRASLAALLTGFPLEATGMAPGEEMVTAGGIPLDEVDPRTMESRLAPGVYMCGELLDIDGFTGGYNLQAAWTTGRIAGLAVARALEGEARRSFHGNS